MSELKNTDLILLQNFLDKNEIPKIKSKPKTFLSIAKQPHYENVMSNIYAFFFDVNEEHGLEDLFINSLLEIIASKKGQSLDVFLNFNVLTEVAVKNQKRIDVLLENKRQAIIIENKVYHHLNNDLKLYYNSIKAETKTGIVLSLHPIINISHKHFINITHIELLTKIMSYLGNYLLKANDKYVIFLKDFYQNILNLTLPQMEEDKLRFYYKNIEKINTLNEYKKAIRLHIENEVRIAFSKLESDGLAIKLYESKGDLGNKLTYYVSEINKNLMFTVIYGNLLQEEQKLILILEIKGKALENKERYRGITVGGEINEGFFTSKNKSYEHFVVKSYTLSDDEILHLNKVIYSKLKEEGFITAFNQLEALLKNNK